MSLTCCVSTMLAMTVPSEIIFVPPCCSALRGTMDDERESNASVPFVDWSTTLYRWFFFIRYHSIVAKGREPFEQHSARYIRSARIVYFLWPAVSCDANTSVFSFIFKLFSFSFIDTIFTSVGFTAKCLHSCLVNTKMYIHQQFTIHTMIIEYNTC